ncbi:Ig-like domain-containing protein [Alicycliphilus denitrificans]|uniref:T1SS-143 repeat domain-containing protein n=1 Tax=Alicycliphilus denitrificans TaxID=179636 RepID=UPI003A8076F2
MDQRQKLMEAVYKSGGIARSTDGKEVLALDRPSIISLKIAPEKVARFERRGDDLVLVLHDGQEMVVRHFFTSYPDDGRNDLVLEDDAGVLWWGQYHGPWTEFHFTEIEWNDEALPFWLLAGLGVLGLGAAAGGGGGGGNGDSGNGGDSGGDDSGGGGGGGSGGSGGGGGNGGGNQPPEAPSYQHTIDENHSANGRVVGRDPDGDTLVYTAGSPPSHGSVVINPDGTYTYTPAPGYHGSDSFTVIVDDGHGGTTTSTVTIEVTPANDSVMARDDSYTVPEDTPLALNLLGNDSAPDGGLHITHINGTPLTPGTAQSIDITDDGTPTGTVIGKVEIDAGGKITFVPALNYNGPASFDYEVEDGDGDTDKATVNITVTPDAPPVIAPIDGNGGGATLIEQGHATVYESGLAGGSGGGSPTATGTITIAAGDGVKSITIGGTTIPLADLKDTGTTPVVITTPHGELTITGYTPNGTDFNGVSTGGTVHYEYKLTTPPANTPGNPDNFIDEISVSIEDEGGGTTTGGLLQINIIDDAPLAADDAVTVTAGGSAAGNVIAGSIATGTGTGGADTAGADGGATVTGISSVNEPGNAPSGTGTLTIQGQYGTLEIHDDGGYSYTRAPGSPGGVNDVFEYTLTDADGDKSTARLTVGIPDSTPGITVTPADPADHPGVDLSPDPALGSVGAVVYEKALGDAANPIGSDAASAAESTTGRFTFSSPDGVQSLLVGGTDIVGATLPVTVTTPLGNTLTITGYTYDPATGQGTVDYSYSLLADETHTQAGADGLDDAIAILLTDMDGDPSSGNIVVRIVDDTPAAGNDGGSVTEGGTLSVTDVANGVLGNDKAGADDWASGGGVVGAVKGSGGAATENVSSGSVVIVGDYGTLTLHANGTYEYVARPDGTSANAQDVFTYTVKDGDGDLITATLAIDVADVTGPTGLTATGTVDEKGLSNGNDPGNGNEVTGNLNLPAGWTPSGTLSGTTPNGSWTIFNDGGTWKYTFTLTSPTTDGPGAETNSFTFTTEDGNGNTAAGNTVTVTIVDDTPQVTVTANPAAAGSLTVYDHQTVGTGTSTATADFSGAFTQTNKPGADGLAAVNGLAWGYELLVGNASSGLTSGGQPITLALAGGQVVGTAGGETVFTLSVNTAGSLTLVQSKPIDHPSTTSTSETLDLLAGRIILRGTATATDGDGDSASQSQELDLGGRIVFTDDGPSIGTPVGVQLRESNLSNGSAPDYDALAQTGSLAVNLNGDAGGAGTDSDVRFDAAQAALETLGLKSGGTPLDYALSPDGKTLTATAGGSVIFTAAINAAGTDYTFTLSRALDHGTADKLDLPIGFTVTDGDGDTAGKTLTVTVWDDRPPTSGQTLTVTEDSSPNNPDNGFNTTADANVTISTPAQHGTASVDAYGHITYVPEPDYSGPDSFTYSITNDDGTITTHTVAVTVTPVADAPDLGGDRTVGTDEDTPVPLGLARPVITDGNDQNGGTTPGDHGERLGVITLTVEGASGGNPPGTVGLSTGGVALVPTAAGNNTYQIIIVTGGTTPDTNLHASNIGSLATGQINYLTQAQYEAIMAMPDTNRHENFRVGVQADSHEVDDSGNTLSPTVSASTTNYVGVSVRAVTDDAELKFDTAAGSGVTNLDGVAYTGDTAATLTLKEDTSVNIKSLLQAAYADMDGSEQHWITITNNSGEAIQVNGVTVAAGATSAAINFPNGGYGNTLPDVQIGGARDFSGDLNGITVTIHAQDRDGDGWTNASTGTPTGGNNASGVAEADTTNNSVTLNLRVTPVAGDVATDPVTEAEDTAVHFLAGVRVTDTGTGSEVIDSVSFTVPAGWAFTAPAASAGWSIAGDGASGTYTISFDSTLNEAAREAVLNGFTIQPPAHSSKDATVPLTVVTTDTNTVNGALVSSPPHTSTTNLQVIVTPAAERTDGDTGGASGNDVIMNGDHVYTGQLGKEDQWFALGTDTTDATNTGGGFALLGSPWSNEDTDEFTYAALTPALTGASPGDSVIGTVFRYHDGSGWKEVVFTGEPVWVLPQYLDTLQIKAPPDVAGTLSVTVQAATVDYDDDAETGDPANPPSASIPGVADVQLSGGALLTLIQIDPVADDVTLALNGHASGLEDTPIPLAIKATSSDPSERIDLTITGVPAGAVLTYDGAPVTVTGGVATITGFDNAKPLTITPPLNGNTDFTLHVSAVSVDGSDMSTPTPARDIEVSVKGVADTPVVALAAAQTYTEAELDGHATTVRLSDLVASVTSPDSSDGSETVSVRITGLAEGFTLTGATLVTSGVGMERVWTVPASQVASVEVKVPANYSGTAGFQVAGVTTENDGDSHTGTMTPVNFTVTPSADGQASTSVALVEDIRTPLGLNIVHANGDIDERLGKVWIQADQVSTADYVLYLGATALSSLPTTTIGGVAYVEIAAADVPSLQVQGSANLDGGLGSFNFRYEVIDDHRGSTPTGPADVVVRSGTFDIAATAVTDPVDLHIIAISGTNSTVTGNGHTGDDADPDTATVTQPGTVVTANLHVDSADTDGSEHVIRVLIDGVPAGVTVVNGAQTDANTWVLVYDGAGAKTIGTAGLDLPVEFIVGSNAGTGSPIDHPITMTVQAQDNGDQADPGTAVETDSVTWHLAINMAQSPGFNPPTIDEWVYNNAKGIEDTPFHLSDVLDGRVTIQEPGQPNTLTVTLTDLPPGTGVSGMVLTSVNGVPTWTASVTVMDGNGQAALDGLLSGITITPPVDYNDNTGGFSFNTGLHTSAAGGRSETATTAMPVPVTPVTDEALIAVNATDVGEGTSGVPVTITVSDPKDGPHGQIVDGKLYVQVDAPGNAGGTLSQGGTALAPTAVTGVAGVPDGNYYVITVGPNGGSASLIYTPAAGSSLQPGDVTFTAYAQTRETNAANTVTGDGSGASTVSIINNGVTMDGNAAWTGSEVDKPNSAMAIPLTGLSVALNDNDGSETVNAILLSGVPVGFLVYANGVLAGNAGGDASSNTWVLSSNGTLPTVSILPPAHWSGTLTGLQLVVESGETSLSDKLVEATPLAPVVVNPVVDGLSIAPTNSFGKEGSVIDLNLNAKMEDPVAAVSAVADGSLETTTLQFKGLGEHAAFYVGNSLLETGAGSGHTLSYDQATGVHTLTGLTQAELDKLGFVQAQSALLDQDAAKPGVQIDVTAWTVEGSSGAQSPQVTGTLDLQVSKVAGTSGADQIIWGGAGKPVIDGRGGEDTVALRLGESASGEDLGLGLKNIEKLDLSIAGGNSVTNLTWQDVFNMASADRTLTILGDGQDSVSLGSGWAAGSSSGGYTEYTNGTGASLVKVLIDEHIVVSHY